MLNPLTTAIGCGSAFQTREVRYEEFSSKIGVISAQFDVRHLLSCAPDHGAVHYHLISEDGLRANQLKAHFSVRLAATGRSMPSRI